MEAPRGTAYTSKGWPQEDAERPDDLVVYGGTARAARDWPSLRAIVRELDELGGDETLLVQPGRPVGLRTHEWAPRVRAGRFAVPTDGGHEGWVSIHHGGVSIGRSIHAGQVCVADGSALAGHVIERVLTNDPATGVPRDVDADYDPVAEGDLRIPMKRPA